MIFRRYARCCRYYAFIKIYAARIHVFAATRYASFSYYSPYYALPPFVSAFFATKMPHARCRDADAARHHVLPHCYVAADVMLITLDAARLMLRY